MNLRLTDSSGITAAIDYANDHPEVRYLVARAASAHGIEIPDTWTDPVLAAFKGKWTDKAREGTGERGVTAAVRKVGFKWNASLHPRGRNGRFIKKGSLVDLFDMKSGSARPVLRAEAVGVERDKSGQEMLTLEVSKPGSYQGKNYKTGDTIKVSPKNVELAAESKGRLQSGDVEGTPSGTNRQSAPEAPSAKPKKAPINESDVDELEDLSRQRDGVYYNEDDRWVFDDMRGMVEDDDSAGLRRTLLDGWVDNGPIDDNDAAFEKASEMLAQLEPESQDTTAPETPAAEGDRLPVPDTENTWDASITKNGEPVTDPDELQKAAKALGLTGLDDTDPEAPMVALNGEQLLKLQQGDMLSESSGEYDLEVDRGEVEPDTIQKMHDAEGTAYKGVKPGAYEEGFEDPTEWGDAPGAGSETPAKPKGDGVDRTRKPGETPEQYADRVAKERGFVAPTYKVPTDMEADLEAAREKYGEIEVPKGGWKGVKTATKNDKIFTAATSDFPNIRMEAAENPNLPPEVARLLAADENPRVRKILLDSSPIPEVLADLIDQADSPIALKWAAEYNPAFQYSPNLAARLKARYEELGGTEQLFFEKPGEPGDWTAKLRKRQATALKRHGVEGDLPDAPSAPDAPTTLSSDELTKSNEFSVLQDYVDSPDSYGLSQEQADAVDSAMFDILDAVRGIEQGALTQQEAAQAINEAKSQIPEPEWDFDGNYADPSGAALEDIKEIIDRLAVKAISQTELDAEARDFRKKEEENQAYLRRENNRLTAEQVKRQMGQPAPGATNDDDIFEGNEVADELANILDDGGWDEDATGSIRDLMDEYTMALLGDDDAEKRLSGKTVADEIDSLVDAAYYDASESDQATLDRLTELANKIRQSRGESDTPAKKMTWFSDDESIEDVIDSLEEYPDEYDVGDVEDAMKYADSLELSADERAKFGEALKDLVYRAQESASHEEGAGFDDDEQETDFNEQQDYVSKVRDQVERWAARKPDEIDTELDEIDTELNGKKTTTPKPPTPATAVDRKFATKLDRARIFLSSGDPGLFSREERKAMAAVAKEIDGIKEPPLDAPEADVENYFLEVEGALDRALELWPVQNNSNLRTQVESLLKDVNETLAVYQQKPKKATPPEPGNERDLDEARVIAEGEIAQFNNKANPAATRVIHARSLANTAKALAAEGRTEAEITDIVGGTEADWTKKADALERMAGKGGAATSGTRPFPMRGPTGRPVVGKKANALLDQAREVLREQGVEVDSMSDLEIAQAVPEGGLKTKLGTVYRPGTTVPISDADRDRITARLGVLDGVDTNAARTERSRLRRQLRESGLGADGNPITPDDREAEKEDLRGRIGASSSAAPGTPLEQFYSIKDELQAVNNEIKSLGDSDPSALDELIARRALIQEKMRVAARDANIASGAIRTLPDGSTLQRRPAENDGIIRVHDPAKSVRADPTDAQLGRVDVGGFVEDLQRDNGSAASALIIEPDGTARFTPERQAIHDRIIASFLDGVLKPDRAPGEKPTMYVLGGGPASGKSTGMTAAGVPEGEKRTTVHVDPDAIKYALLAEGVNWDTETPEGVGYVHEESSYLAKRLNQAGLERGLDVTLDGTGDGNPNSQRKKVLQAKATRNPEVPDGYRVVGSYMTVPVEGENGAIARDQRRSRTVGEYRVRITHSKVSAVFPDIEDSFDEVTVWDTNVPRGDSPILVYQRKPGSEGIVLEPDLYQQFLDKANAPMPSNLIIPPGEPGYIAPGQPGHPAVTP